MIGMVLEGASDTATNIVAQYSKFKNVVILSVAKPSPTRCRCRLRQNLSTGRKLNFQAIARPFASLRVTNRMMVVVPRCAPSPSTLDLWLD